MGDACTLVKPVSDFIQQVGFPIAVALWLLLRTDKKLDKLTDAMNEINVPLASIVTALEKIIKENKEGD